MTRIIDESAGRDTRTLRRGNLRTRQHHESVGTDEHSPIPVPGLYRHRDGSILEVVGEGRLQFAQKGHLHGSRVVVIENVDGFVTVQLLGEFMQVHTRLTEAEVAELPDDWFEPEVVDLDEEGSEPSPPAPRTPRPEPVADAPMTHLRTHGVAEEPL